MIHSIRAGRESSKVNLEVVEECEPSEKQNSEQKKPLPFDEVDEIVKQFYKNNKMLWMDSNSGWKYLQSKYSPTRMPAHSFQNAKDCSALQRQAEVHLNVAALLSAFAFSAAASEGAQSSANSSPIDQAIFINLSLATVLFLGTVLHFMYIDMGLGSKGGSRYWQTYSAKLGTSCVTFHVGCLLLAASFPMWAYRKFSVQPAFFVTLVFAVLWFIYDFLVLLPSHNQMNQLLAHAELGIDAQKFLKPSLFAKHWTPEAWEAMYNADPVVDDVGTGSKLTSKGQIAPVAAAVM